MLSNNFFIFTKSLCLAIGNTLNKSYDKVKPRNKVSFNA